MLPSLRFNVRAAVACEGQRVVGHGVQLAAVYGIGAGVAQCAGCDVFNLYGFAAVFADEADGVGRIGAGSAGVVNVLHRGVEADFGYAVFAFDFGDCALAVGEVDGVAVGYEVFRYAVALDGEACVEYVVDGRRIAAAFAFGQVGTAAALPVC